MELVDFLRARLDEDGQEIRKLCDLIPRLEWMADRAMRLEREMGRRIPRAEQAEIMRLMKPEPDGLTWLEGTQMRRTALDPARILAEVEAKQQILKAHERLPDGSFCVTCDAPTGIPGEPFGCATVRLLGLPYADHADYREEWRP